MAIYIRVDTISYKLPNRIIVGRGEPFTQFNEDRSIARAHLILVRKKNGVYVKDLGSAAGTFIDGKKLPKKKLVKWNQEHELRIGNYPVALLATAVDKECIKVSAIKGLSNPTDQVLKWLYSGIMAFSMYKIWFANTKNALEAKLSLSAYFGFVFICLYFITKLFIKFTSPKNTQITDIFLSQDGFTVHYDAGGNMTLMLKDIDEWKRHLGGAIILMKNGEVYNFVQIENREKLVQKLESHVPKREVNKSWFSNNHWIVLVGTIFIVAYFDLINKISPALFMIFIPAGVAYSFFFSKEKKWITNNRFMNRKKMGLMIGCWLLITGFIFFTAPTKRDFALDEQKNCTKAAKVCKAIDYDALATQDIDYEKLKIACDVGNKKACSRLSPERLPSSVD